MGVGCYYETDESHGESSDVTTRNPYGKSASDERKIHDRLMVHTAFLLSGLDYSLYDDCVRACVKKCEATDAYLANDLNGWKGLPDAEKILRSADSLARLSECEIMIPATTAIALPVMKTIRKVGINEDSKVSQLIARHHIFEKIPTAVHHYNRRELTRLSVVRGVPHGMHFTRVMKMHVKAARRLA